MLRSKNFSWQLWDSGDPISRKNESRNEIPIQSTPECLRMLRSDPDPKCSKELKIAPENSRMLLTLQCSVIQSAPTTDPQNLIPNNWSPFVIQKRTKWDQLNVGQPFTQVELIKAEHFKNPSRNLRLLWSLSEMCTVASLPTANWI